MVGIVRAMKVAMPPTAKIATRITHIISVSLAYNNLYPIKDRHSREKIQTFLSSFVKLNQSVLVNAHFYIIDQSLIDWLMFRFYYSTNLKGFSLLPDLVSFKGFLI